MIHPLLHLIATKPQLLGNHAEAYAELIGAELAKTSRVWARRLALMVATSMLLASGVIFCGLAVMLWAVVPTEDMPAPGLLIAVPLISFALGGLCYLYARAQPATDAFSSVKEQLHADMAMLREVSSET